MVFGDKNLKGNYRSCSEVKLIRGGVNYFNLLIKLIDSATKSIHLQTYIYSDDETGTLVANALKLAVKRKVDVHLLVDGYASQSLSKNFIKELKEAGIDFRFFEPFLKGKHFYFGRRLHHKMLVVDTRHALVGGINISNRYNDMPGEPAWLDFALYAKGEIAIPLCVLCWKTWKNFPINMGITPCEQEKILFKIPANKEVLVGMFRNDWVRHKNEISGVYIEMLRSAKSTVVILSSYFLPGRVIRRQIAQATKRGVEVKVIAAGPSDVWLAKNAERWLYDWLLRTNVKLYEYKQNVLHGKIAVCDNEWVTIGSYNINDLSTYASIELNLVVRNSLFAEETRKVLQGLIDTECILITKEQHASTKNIFKQFIRWLSYHLIRFLFFLFTFYFKQRN